MPLTREDYRKRIHNEFCRSRSETISTKRFPLDCRRGEVMDSRPARPQTIRLAAGHQTLRLPSSVPVADRKEADILTLESNYYATLRENKHMDEAARPSADRLLPHPAALRRQRPGDRLPLPLGQPDGAADSGRRRRRLPRQDSPRNRPPRRPAYRRAGGHRAGRLQDGPVACRQDRPLLPQFLYNTPNDDGNRHPDPRLSRTSSRRIRRSTKRRNCCATSFRTPRSASRYTTAPGIWWTSTPAI